jgi:plasmid maintenance system antidote protein VapI
MSTLAIGTKRSKARAPSGARPVEPKILPAGCYVFEELAARGWNARTLAIAADMPLATVRAILGGAAITAREAAALDRAFGSPVGLWSHLDGLYRQWLAASDPDRGRRV